MLKSDQSVQVVYEAKGLKVGSAITRMLRLNAIGWRDGQGGYGRYRHIIIGFGRKVTRIWLQNYISFNGLTSSNNPPLVTKCKNYAWTKK